MSEGKKDSYFISESEFAKKPTEIKNYGSIERVTRENFTSVLINSFLFSRGDFGIQYIYFDWLTNKTGLDWKVTLQNFMKVGGWTSLTFDEQRKFELAYTPIPYHRVKFDHDQAERLHYNLSKLIHTPVEGNETKEFRQLYNDFFSSNSLPDSEVEFARVINGLKRKK